MGVLANQVHAKAPSAERGPLSCETEKTVQYFLWHSKVTKETMNGISAYILTAQIIVRICSCTMVKQVSRHVSLKPWRLCCEIDMGDFLGL